MTLIQEMQQDALRILDLDGIHSLKLGTNTTTIVFEKQSLNAVMKFIPTESRCDGWTITAERTPTIVRIANYF